MTRTPFSRSKVKGQFHRGGGILWRSLAYSFLKTVSLSLRATHFCWHTGSVTHFSELEGNTSHFQNGVKETLIIIIITSSPQTDQRVSRDGCSVPVRATSLTQSCGRRGHRSTAAAVDVDAAARHIAYAWQVPGRVCPEVSRSQSSLHLATGH